MEYKGNVIEAVANDRLMYNGKPVKVIENRKYTYKFNKTSISAEGGAHGLVEFMRECVETDFGLVWVDAIVEHIGKLVNGEV